MPRQWRSVIMIPAIILLCSLLGSFYGPGLTGVSAASTEEELDASVSKFTEIYSVVEANFATQLDPDTAIYEGAIPGMLRTLDPHSSFFDPRQFQLLREDQKGHYYGVGMYVRQNREGYTLVMMPFAGSPARKAGLRPGDVILSVDDKDAQGLGTSAVADLLKGPRGTPVQVSVRRPGVDQPLTFNIIRDEIPRASVKHAFLLKPGMAYLAIDQFNENTSQEVDEKLGAMGEDKLQGLVLDLRGNPGGLLQEGVAVAGRFLQRGQIVVKHRGRTASSERPYQARPSKSGIRYPIVVLVDERSASAAEIVSGALQDHDRGWVLGDNTFGKGLVQTVYPLRENTGLALTTARYYTPSGRLIQREYRNKSFFDYYYRKDHAANDPMDVKMTDSGRTVYGGNGITPDEMYKAEPLTAFQRKAGSALFNFTAFYLGTHSPKIGADWAPDEEVLSEFHKYMLKEDLQFTEAEFTEGHDWVRQQLRVTMYGSAISDDASRRVEIENDPAVHKAMESMPKAAALLVDAKKLVAQRNGTAQ